jgi:ubiquitin carboxyl-terminal hydrolase 9/24
LELKIQYFFAIDPNVDPKKGHIDKEFFNFVWKDWLFRKKNDENEINYPICKSEESREGWFSLLLELMNTKDNSYFSKFITKIVKWMEKGDWRTTKDRDWEIKKFEKPRKASKYFTSSDFNGLKNMGCTCYMNSVLQQLFMIVPFRASILTVRNQQEEEKKSADVLYNSKLLFESLLSTGTSYHDPEHFFKTLRDVDGSELNPLEQRDADEFLSRYFEILEPQIKGTREFKDITNIFQGTFANQMICIDCPHKSEREEEFSNIPLQVKNKNSLEDAFDSFIDEEILQGDNAYYWDKCEKKVSCRRRTCIKKLPNIMVVALKRFELDYETMQHNKINDKVEFPLTIKMDKYTDQILEKKDLMQEMEGMNWSYNDLTEDKKRIYDFEFPEEYYTYKLRGVVIHMGEANSGHYYSYIQDTKTENWYEFNDTHVTKFDPNDMAEKAFGGDFDDDKRFSRWRNVGNKTYNAYMLFYEREFFIKTDDFMAKMEEANTKLEDLQAFFNQRFSRLQSTIQNDDVRDREVEDIVLRK